MFHLHCISLYFSIWLPSLSSKSTVCFFFYNESNVMGIINLRTIKERQLFGRKKNCMYCTCTYPKRVDQKLWSYSSDHRLKHCWITLSFFPLSVSTRVLSQGVCRYTVWLELLNLLCLSSITLASTSRHPTYQNLSRIIGEMLFISLSGHAVSLVVFCAQFLIFILGGYLQFWNN